MTTQNILQDIGDFSAAEIDLFELYTSKLRYNKNEVLLKQGQVCQALYFILSGCFVQSRSGEVEDSIIDLHTRGTWMYNHQSLVQQCPSQTTVTTFCESEVVCLTLVNFHYLVSRSPAFLQFGRIMNQDQHRTLMFDNASDPVKRYEDLIRLQPDLVNTFPVKMIASYLKMAPETLSRVRSRMSIC